MLSQKQRGDDIGGGSFVRRPPISLGCQLVLLLLLMLQVRLTVVLMVEGLLVLSGGDAEELCKVSRNGSRCRRMTRRHRIADAPAAIDRVNGASAVIIAVFERAQLQAGSLRRLMMRRRR